MNDFFIIDYSIFFMISIDYDDFVIFDKNVSHQSLIDIAMMNIQNFKISGWLFARYIN